MCQPAEEVAASKRSCTAMPKTISRPPTRLPRKADASRTHRCDQGDRHGRSLVGEGEGKIRPNARSSKLFKELESRRHALLACSTPAGASTGAIPKTVRPIVAEVGVLPRTHGSALFTRGETQALVVATLGTGEDEQFVDSLEGTYKQHFMLHYNFPPFSVGEVGPHERPRPARNRPRQACLARDPSAAAGQEIVPLHHPRRLRDHWNRTALRRWRRCAALRWR